MTAWPAYFCAAANLVAVIAMATVLAPGTTLVEEPARAAYVRENAVGWRLGWSLWIVATVSLLLFYRWWAGRVRAGATLVWVAVAGLATDVVAQSLLIAVVPDRPDLARAGFMLTGGAANGLYTLAGALLSRVTPVVRGAFAVWTWTMWGAGAVLSAATLLELPLAIAAASAALFALFIPWCVAMGRRLG